jgi:hypothetical protein
VPKHSRVLLSLAPEKEHAFVDWEFMRE